MTSEPKPLYSPDALGYFLTWTTYGTWLPGDQRGWTQRLSGDQTGDEFQNKRAKSKLGDSPCTLDLTQREIVNKVIRAHCEIRDWRLHAVNCRTNHVHVVVTTCEDPKEVLRQFKAWAARRLNEHGPRREKWWTERGSGRYLYDQESLESATVYTLDAQDRKSRDR
ncbi:transposase [Blastopirellula sediminis]|uniref:transposase n=1 Tax=Blastopirellula sediminis TaxID=2894196 RepID=UPI0036F24737